MARHCLVVRHTHILREMSSKSNTCCNAYFRVLECRNSVLILAHRDVCIRNLGLFIEDDPTTLDFFICLENLMCMLEGEESLNVEFNNLNCFDVPMWGSSFHSWNPVLRDHLILVVSCPKMLDFVDVKKIFGSHCWSKISICESS